MRFHSLGPERRHGVTKLQVLAGILVLGTLIGLSIPAVRRMREADARTQSTNHLKQLGLAFHSYHDANKYLPWNGSFAAYAVKNAGDDGVSEWGGPAKPGGINTGSWAFQILPNIDQKAMFLQGNVEATQDVGIAMLMCPGRGRPLVCTEGLEPTKSGGPWSDYAINCWINDSALGSLSGPSNRRTLVGITDGTSNTILVGDATMAAAAYTAPNGVWNGTMYTGGTIFTCRGANCALITIPQTMVIGGAASAANLTTINNAWTAANTPALGANVSSFGRDPQGNVWALATAPTSLTVMWGGPFAQGGLMGMADATVRMFPYQITNLPGFLTANGGETVTLPDT